MRKKENCRTDSYQSKDIFSVADILRLQGTFAENHSKQVHLLLTKYFLSRKIVTGY